MGLKIQRKANPSANAPESRALMSARYAYRLEVVEDSSPHLTVEVHDFANRNHELDNEAVKNLFTHLWKQVTAHRQLNIVINLSQIEDAAPRFRRELGYLRRQLRRQGRTVRLSNISLKCHQESPFEIV